MNAVLDHVVFMVALGIGALLGTAVVLLGIAALSAAIERMAIHRRAGK